MTLQIKKGDRVRIRTGKDKGRYERVLEVRRDAHGHVAHVVVEHVNMVHRHKRASYRQQGGIMEREAAIPISKVMLVDSKTNQATRFGVGFDADGRKIRIAKKSGAPV